jgi:hypothetical protein
VEAKVGGRCATSAQLECWQREVDARGEGVRESMELERRLVADHAGLLRPEPRNHEVLVLSRREAYDAVDSALTAREGAAANVLGEELVREAEFMALRGGKPARLARSDRGEVVPRGRNVAILALWFRFNIHDATSCRCICLILNPWARIGKEQSVRLRRRKDSTARRGRNALGPLEEVGAAEGGLLQPGALVVRERWDRLHLDEEMPQGLGQGSAVLGVGRSSDDPGQVGSRDQTAPQQGLVLLWHEATP